jgi:hypothetical protein
VCALLYIVGLLREDKEAHVFVFVNFCSEVLLCASSLEEILANELLCEGVFRINWDMDKVKTFANTQLFTSSLIMR